MSEATSYSKLGYLALKKESASGTAVYPDTPLELLTESMNINWDFTSVSQIAGHRSMNSRPALNQVGPFEGTIEAYVDPRGIGHWLLGIFGEDVVVTLSAGESYQHDFEPLNTLKSFTMDIKEAGEDYVKRFYGTHVKKITLTKDENKIHASIDVIALGAFSNARLTVAHASGVTLDLDQTSGLTLSDSLLIYDDAAPDTLLATLTISAIGSEKQLTSSTIGVSLGIDDIVAIKARVFDTEDYLQTNELIFAGGADVYMSNGANALQALTAKTNVEDFEITIENEFEPRWSATGTDVVDRMPFALLLKGVTVTGKINQFHTNPAVLDMLRKNEQVGLRFNFYGEQLDTNSAAAATGVLESTGAGTVTVTVDSAGEAGNDYAIIVVQGTSTLSVSLSGKLITITLDTDAADNAVATVATALDALAGLSATSASTGNVSIVDNPDKVEFSGGRDANETELLRFDFPNVRFNVFDANLSAEDIVNEEIPFTAYRDENDEREVKVRLRTVTADY